ncbi:MAG: SUMF1/EgtB/PvdO family nonheme iron enzyme [Nitrososphaerales archaeon]
MHALDAFLEIDDDGAEQGARIWVPSLPGFTVRGRNEDETLTRLKPLARKCLRWLGGETARILAGGWNGQFRLEEVHHDASQVGNFFGWDLGPCTRHDMENHLYAMSKSRGELERLVMTMPAACQDWTPVPFAPRPPKLIALHIAATEIWYLNQFFDDERVTEGLAAEAGLDGTGIFELDSRGWDYNLGGWYTSADLTGFMKATRGVFERVVTSASKNEMSEVVSSRSHQSKEQWTLRKVLRRAAWHEREHMTTLRRYIRQFRLERRALNRTPEGSVDPDKLKRILSWKTELVQLMVSSIHPADRPLYAKELVKILGDQTSDPGVRRAAADALNFAGDPRIRQTRPQMVRIPAGRFTVGISEERARQLAKEAGLPPYAFRIETPERIVELPGYRVSRYPVTNMEYLRFVRETGRRPPSWWSGTVVGPSFLPWKANHPVWGVSWDDVVSYCRWLSKKSGAEYHLPHETEWEKASRGTDGRDYPWGNVFTEGRCNTAEAKIGGTTPVGVYPHGASPFGVMDMAGNVEEWTLDSPSSNNSTLAEGSRFLRTQEHKITKGGGWRDSWYATRCSSKCIRDRNYDIDAGGRIGFRLATGT